MRAFAVLFTLSWIAGLAVGVLVVAPWLMLTITIVTIGLLLLPDAVPFRIAAIALLLIGTLYGSSTRQTLTDGCAVASTQTVTIVERPQYRSQDTRYVVEASDCKILVTTTALSHFHEGEQIRVTGGSVQSIQELPPEYVGYKNYLQRQGIGATWRYPQLQVQSEGKREPTVYDRTHERITQLFPAPSASLVVALLIGDMSGIPADIQNAFRTTGVSHILSISGLHISVIAGVGVVLVRLLPLPALLQTLLVVAVLSWYVWFIGFPVAALRALLFWIVILIGLRLHRLISLPTMLLLSALLIVSLNPTLIADIGFQLSFSAVVGMFGSLFLMKHLTQKAPTWIKSVSVPLLVSLGATISTWPIVSYHFGTFSTIGLVANLIIVPLSTAVLLSAAAAFSLFLISPSVGLVVAYVPHLLIQLMTMTTSYLARLPGASLTVIEVSGWMLLIYYAALIGAVYAGLWIQQRSWREIWQ